MILLMGKSGSGQDTVIELLKQHGFRTIVAYTTRPQRDGEVDNHFIVTETYLTNEDIWEYGVAKDDVLGADNRTILVLNPKTGKKLVAEHPELDIKSVYLYCPERVLEKRLLARGDNAEEALRRLTQDDKDFKNVEKWVDAEIYNSSTNPEVAANSIIRYLEVNE